MKYTKHNIIRIKDLTTNFFEIIFARDHLKFVPGSVLELKGIKGDRHPLFIASEPDCGWVRVIADKREYPGLYTLKPKDTLKVCTISTTVDIPNGGVGFIVSDVGISPVFSLISTFPQQKQTIYYLDNEPISLEYLQHQHQVYTKLEDLEEEMIYYLIGSRKYLEPIKQDNIIDCRYE